MFFSCGGYHSGSIPPPAALLTIFLLLDGPKNEYRLAVLWARVKCPLPSNLVTNMKQGLSLRIWWSNTSKLLLKFLLEQSLFLLLIRFTNSFMDNELLSICSMWQDIVIALVGLSFGFMLLPQVRDCIHGKSVNVYTAGLTTIGLYILAIAFFTLEMWITVIAEIFSGTVWLLLFFFSLMNERKKK